jgi:hypothetical protein
VAGRRLRRAPRPHRCAMALGMACTVGRARVL